MPHINHKIVVPIDTPRSCGVVKVLLQTAMISPNLYVAIRGPSIYLKRPCTFNTIILDTRTANGATPWYYDMVSQQFRSTSKEAQRLNDFAPFGPGPNSTVSGRMQVFAGSSCSDLICEPSTSDFECLNPSTNAKSLLKQVCATTSYLPATMEGTILLSL
jgi:hypothetical protein